MRIKLSLISILVAGYLSLSAQVQSFNFETIAIENLSINSEAVEFGPGIFENQLIFVGADKQVGDDSFFSLYKAELKYNGQIVSSSSITPFLESSYHKGPVTYCAETGELFVTQSNVQNIDVQNTVFKKKQVRLGIVTYKKINNQWELKEHFPYNSSDCSIAHPAINKTGDTLIFSSNMEGGYGTSDLYFSVKKNHGWSSPENMGKKINSSGSEITPFWSSDNQIYFASNGRKGRGGFDLYVIENPFSSKPLVKNLGKSINTKYNEYGLTIHPNQLYGYFASNRENGIGEDDVYLIQSIPQPITYAFIDQFSKKKIVGVQLNTEPIGSNELISDSNGIIEVRYNFNSDTVFTFNHDNYFGSIDTINARDFVNELTRKKDILLTPYPTLNVSIINEETKQALDANIKIEYHNIEINNIKSKADSLASFRLTNKGNYILKIEKDGFIGIEHTFEMPVIDKPSYSLTIELTPIYEGKTFTLENLYYDLNSSEIRSDAALVLDGLYKILIENPKIKIELSAHTDCRESESYNKWLSQNRAKAAVDYLIEKGIHSDRLISKGYGKSKPIISCPNCDECTDEEHQQNRRTEIEILEH